MCLQLLNSFQSDCIVEAVCSLLANHFLLFLFYISLCAYLRTILMINNNKVRIGIMQRKMRVNVRILILSPSVARSSSWWCFLLLCYVFTFRITTNCMLMFMHIRLICASITYFVFQFRNAYLENEISRNS